MVRPALCIAVVLVAVLLLTSRAHASLPVDVSVSLETEWAHTPLLLEASEFFASVSSNTFWSFVEAATTDEGVPRMGSSTDQAQTQWALALGQRVLSPTRHKQLQLALAMRQYSPRVSMHRSLTSERVTAAAAECGTQPEPALFGVGGDVHCDVASALQAARALATTDDAAVEMVLPQDHVYPASAAAEGLPVVVAMADVTHPQWPEVHTRLVAASAAQHVRYVLRHLVPHSSRRVPLQGYGVQLMLKSTEYKVIDERNADAGDSSNGATNADTAASATEEDAPHGSHTWPELVPIHKDDLKDLGFKVAQHVLTSDDPMAQLESISQNLPTLSADLARIPLDEQVVAALKRDQSRRYYPGQTMVLLNGRYIPVENVDIYELVNIIATEADKVAALRSLSLATSSVLDVLSMKTPPMDKPTYDVRSEWVYWLNDLEKDPMYAKWPKTMKDFLKAPALPVAGGGGGIRHVAKNLINVVVAVNPGDLPSLYTLYTMQTMIMRQMPIRVGVVFAANSAADAHDPNSLPSFMTRTFHHLYHHHEPVDAVNFFLAVAQATIQSQLQQPTLELARETLANFNVVVEEEDVEDDAAASQALAASHNWLRGTMRNTLELPHLFLNGQLLTLRSAQEAPQVLFQAMMLEYQRHMVPIASGVLDDTIPDLYDHLLAYPDVLPAFSRYAFPTEQRPLRFHRLLTAEPLKAKAEAAQVTQGGEPAVAHLGPWLALSTDAKTEAFLADVDYVTHVDAQDHIKAVTHVAALDTTSVHGVRQLRYLLDMLLPSNQGADVRLAVVPHPDVTSVNASPLLRLLSVELRGLSVRKAWAVVDHVRQWLETTPDGVAIDGEAQAVVVEQALQTATNGKQRGGASSGNDLRWKRLQAYVRHVLLEAYPDSTLLLTNGRIIAVDAHDVLPLRELTMLNAVERQQRTSPLLALLDDMEFSAVDGEDALDPDDMTAQWKSDLLMKVASLLGSERAEGLTKYDFTDVTGASFVLEPPVGSSADFELVGVLDPLSPAAQRFATIFRHLMRFYGARVRIVLNPVGDLEQIPLRQYYRYVMTTETAFNGTSGEQQGCEATFAGLPRDTLLSMNVDVPDAWMVQALHSNRDLDNLRFSARDGNAYGGGPVVRARFELRHLLIEGSCYDATLGQATRGLELQLLPPPFATPVREDANGDDHGDEHAQGSVTDTLVMENLGYFQLKAPTPGVWYVRTPNASRSQQLYEWDASHMTGLVADAAARGHVSLPVVVDSFGGSQATLRLQKRPGMERERLLLGDPTEGNHGGDDGSVWSRVRSMFTSSSASSTPLVNQTVHVFSVASGHLYERFLSIMMLTVRKHTQNPVKFWLLENFLSPDFKRFIPHMAAHYGFDYELVTYRWPRWLRAQTEKQRIIWAYKILFLDVLFPLDVERIIFVDADQVVRADLSELVSMDLQGAPYGYTPFCDSRPETDGFRFWKSGFWKEELKDRPYHISALYVVDLQRFRQMAAGDVLRSTYHQLSRDPNSLANLDQDLPNVLQKHLPIFSLPQEWLWCETWCSDESLKTAKTIDLCNNPLTKAPKLENAVRIVPEWTSLDDEVSSLRSQYDAIASAAASSGDDNAVVEGEAFVDEDIVG